MCGIAGIYKPRGGIVDPALVVNMTNALRHRGPDDEGFLLADTRSGITDHRRGDDTRPEIRKTHIADPLEAGFSPNVVLGWRRLGIIDLSPTGHEPMSDEGERVWLVFNGEIYNYRELRGELKSKGHTFRTQSDAEVILESYKEWGTACLGRFNGMWSFALWDAGKQTLFCARDRFGVKPFYYTWAAETFVFASEIKALLENPGTTARANDSMVYDYLVHRALDHTEQTFFDGIFQLRPGHFALIDRSGPHIEQYYALETNSELGQFDEQEATRYADRFRELFVDSVRLRLRSDVTLGSCLSGGVDSSSIVCVLNNLLASEGLLGSEVIGDRQKTFTATYDLRQYAEDGFVQRVIERTNTASFFIKPSAQGLWSDLSSLIRTNDEPFNSTSMYAQWNVMKLTAEHGVKVVLDGQGADELLAGYRRWHFPIFHAELLRAGRLSEFIREIRASASIAGVSSTQFLGNVIQKLSRSFIPKPLHLLFLTQADFLHPDFSTRSFFDKQDMTLQTRLWEDETRNNLQQLLHYEDRNSMRFSVEARVPFVDYRLVEFVMRMPAVYKIHAGWSKYILRRAMEGVLPKEIQWRRDKMGFVTPEKEWLNELMPSIVGRLKSEPFRSSRYIDGRALLNRLDNPRLRVKSYDAWRFINLELWMREFRVV
ncbi:MAG TPA: asparagine synthase (glutamine-hydrolyzing) [Bacteroidota bacterium]|nr:asparagine synthase (glutamine-hydrolyzing) [Bacteroidota bacterium]